jgi:phosphate acetyltransferase
MYSNAQFGEYYSSCLTGVVICLTPAALQVLKTASGASIVSSIFFMLLEDGVNVFGDCVINVDPTAEQLAEIVVASAKSSIQFVMDPRVALLSYATGDSNSGDAIDKVIKATAFAKKIA